MKKSVFVLFMLVLLLVTSGISCASKQTTVNDSELLKVKPTKNLDDEIPKDITDALSVKKPVAILFYANWDQVSDQVAAYYESTRAQAAYSKAKFVKINVDDPDNAYIVAKFNVGFLPDLVILDGNGKTVMRKNGWIDLKTLQSGISAAVRKDTSEEEI